MAAIVSSGFIVLFSSERQSTATADWRRASTKWVRVLIVLLGICFWRKGFEAAFGPDRMGEKGG